MIRIASSCIAAMTFLLAPLAVPAAEEPVSPMDQIIEKVKFEDATLSEVTSYISTVAKINIVTTPAANRAMAKTKVTLSLSNLPVRELFTFLCRATDLQSDELPTGVILDAPLEPPAEEARTNDLRLRTETAVKPVGDGQYEVSARIIDLASGDALSTPTLRIPANQEGSISLGGTENDRNLSMTVKVHVPEAGAKRAEISYTMTDAGTVTWASSQSIQLDKD